nr:MerR family transcriptional regulator [Streptomyces sp. NBC_00886]
MAAGVSPATIRKWASRGKLTRHGAPQRAEYDLDELRALTAGSSRTPPDQPPGHAARCQSE